MREEPRELSPLERVTLFVCAMHKADADELLSGFAAGPRKQAAAFAQQILGLDSSTRQARLTREFGARADALDRMRALIVEAPLPLRAAIVELLPPAQRALFPQLLALPLTASPAMTALAARLLREATR